MSRLLSPRRALSAFLAAALVATLGAPSLAQDAALPEASAPTRVEIADGVTARLVDGRRIEVEALPEPSEGYLSLAERLCGERALADALKAANRGNGLMIGVPTPIPWSLLRPEFRFLALRELFPSDEAREGEWVHRPGDSPLPVVGLGLWQVAEWFTGSGEKWSEVAAHNGLASPEIPRDASIRIPEKLLLPLFRFDAESDDGRLRFREDEEGDYAEYRLARGEALYSAVALRFTGVSQKELADEMVRIIADRSAIADVTDIPIGYPVKIPLELLATPFLPNNDPRRVRAQLLASELAAIELPAGPSTLTGVHVILDAGHGGVDPGAYRRDVWESDFVYDVAMRIKRLLEAGRGARVHMTIRDTEHGDKIFESRKIPHNKREVLLTTPPFRLDHKSRVRPGVNMRWQLANHLHGKLRKQGVEESRIVFLSLHADALHRSIRGGMVYVPGTEFRNRRYGLSGSLYKRYSEYSSRRLSFTRKERLRDEKVSTKLGEAILEGFREEKLAVHHDRPLRDHIVRRLHRRRKPVRFVPAVLGGNVVQAKVLVETVNLNNEDDVKLMADPEGRERMARAIVRGLERFFDGG